MRYMRDMRDIKLIAIDLDDTLLDQDLKVSPRAVEAIQKAKAKGVQTTIATGRMYSSALPFAKQLEINLPLITYQGALVKNSLSDEVLVHKPVPLKLAREVISLVREKGHPINIYVNDRLFVEKLTEEGLAYARLSGVPINPVGDLIAFLKDEPTKILVVATEEDIRLLQEEFKARYSKDELHITTSKPYFLEFSHPQATKATALEYLIKLYGITREQVMAIGDSYNDLEMIEYAGFGVVMGNAKEDIKKVADYVGPSNDEDGVARIIEKYVLGKEQE